MQIAEKRPEKTIRNNGAGRQHAQAAGKRLTVNLGPEAVAALDAISDGGTKTYVDIIRDAIWLEERIHGLLHAGGQLYYRTPEGELHMLILR